MLDALIDEILVNQVAEKQGYLIDPSEVESKFKKIEAKADGTKQIKDMNTQSGRVEGEIRSEIQSGLLRNRMKANVYEKAIKDGLDPEARWKEFLNGLKISAKIILYE